MRSLRSAPTAAALAALLLGPLTAATARAQQEPSLFEETPAKPGASPSPTPIPLVRPPARAQPLRATLDFVRWQEMDAGERQVFVEGAVLTMRALVTRLRIELGPDAKMPPDRLAALVKFVNESYPTRPVEVYEKEMDTIYMTAEGQKLSMLDCFLQGFRQVNGR